MSVLEKAQRTASTLRRVADSKAMDLSRFPSGGGSMRNSEADALADLAELVLGLVAVDLARRL